MKLQKYKNSSQTAQVIIIEWSEVMNIKIIFPDFTEVCFDHFISIRKHGRELPDRRLQLPESANNRAWIKRQRNYCNPELQTDHSRKR